MSTDLRAQMTDVAIRRADSTPRARARDLWALARRKPAVASRRTFALTTGGSYVLAGLIGFVVLATAPVSLKHAALLSLIAALAVSGGTLTVLIGHLVPHRTLHLILAAGTLLMTIAVSLISDYPPAAVDDGMMFLAITVGCAYYFDLVSAAIHVIAAEICMYIAAQFCGLYEGEIAYLQAILVFVAVAVAWLTRAAAAADRDALTGLYNRRGFDLHLGRAIADAQRDDQSLAVVVIDLDDFKSVNDLSGHGEGDRLLAAIAQIWGRNLAPGLTMCRQGGDEFALILPGFTANRAAAVADELRALVRHETSFSAGVAELRADDSQSMLLGRADVALYNSKSGGGGQTCQYGVTDDGSTSTEFYRALADGEFEVYFQPILDLSIGEVTGDEALIRWNHPTRGMVSPLDFIPLAESVGAIHAIGAWILRAACEQTVGHNQQTGRSRSISVNASGHELTNPDYAANVATVLAETGLEPSLLIIEVTESTFDADHQRVLAVLRNLRELGVRIAIDDFGTGYSSLNRLENLPANVLKIDQSFVAAIPESGGDVPVLRAIVSMAIALNLKIVAEGVETARQAQVLAELGCSHAQGYYFGRPAPYQQDLPANSIHRRRTAVRHLPADATRRNKPAVA
ncbi:bifunctional diguanylate cyclase/phosphodiesterase [Jatrophihabitans sp. GAS493]|uniref:putative bifunctional diguanylate cyclase/phosphodiesterase n=1 Tax=Jatrophihabitans sp. GAS493 TaxID=1907575 RepID=UPI00156014E5|nr:bifunctional diguanylate cyclase/phosphodiesterase [Jatrophihabitans sp. GAS493]